MPSSYFELPPQNHKQPLTAGLDTSPGALCPFHHRDNQFRLDSISTPAQSLPLSIGLVPEFYLSVPAAGDDLGGLVWMP